MSDADRQEDTVVGEPEPVTDPENPEGAEAPAGAPVPRRARGWTSLYLAAFVLLLISGLAVALAARSFLESLAPLYVSIALSVLAAILAVAALFLPKRG